LQTARKTLPDRADKVLHQIADCHGGNLNDSQYGRRIKGAGNIASQINRQFEIANHLYKGFYIFCLKILI